MRPLFVAAEIQQFVAIPQHALPLLFKQRLQLGYILQDDGHKHIAGTHGGQLDLKVVWQTDIGKLVHQEMDRDRQAAAMLMVGAVKQLLEKLLIQNRHQKVEAGVAVGDQRKQRHPFFTHVLQMQFIRGRQGNEGIQIELLHVGRQCDLNAFQRFGAAGAVLLVILHGDMLRIPHFQPFKEHIQRREIAVVVLPDLSGPKHLHNHWEILFLRWGLVIEIIDQRREKNGCGGIPEGVLRLCALGRCRLKEIRHQHLHLIVVGQIDEGVIAVAFLHVQQIQHPDIIARFPQQSSGIPQQLALGVKADKGRPLRRQARFIQAGLCIAAGLACAAAADYDRVQVAPVLPSVQPHADMLGEHLVRLRWLGAVFPVQPLRAAPFCGAVFHATPVAAPGGQHRSHQQAIGGDKKEDSLSAVLAPNNMKRMLHCCRELPDDPEKSTGCGRGHQQPQPHRRKQAQQIPHALGFTVHLCTCPSGTCSAHQWS